MEQDEYFVRIDGHVYGPMDIQRLRSFVAEGRLFRSSEVSTDCTIWRKAETVPGLFPLLSQPLPSQEPIAASPEADSSGGEAEVPKWHLRSPDGASLGPISERELLEMVRNGRVRLQRLAWREGFDGWRPLGDTELAFEVRQALRVADRPRLRADAVRRPLAKHRGDLILVFGILGMIFCVFFGIAAWLMADKDLEEMSAGRMDPSGQGLTRAGRITGMLGCAIVIVLIVMGWFNRITW